MYNVNKKQIKDLDMNNDIQYGFEENIDDKDDGDGDNEYDNFN